MKIIVAGFTKTGNSVLAEALTLLGYKTYGFLENALILGDQWKYILTNGPSEERFVEMYEDVDVVYDLPACYYWRELLQAFPKAKVIFMSRDEQEWLRLWRNQIELWNKDWIFNTLNRMISKSANQLIEIEHLIGRIVFGGEQPRSANVYSNISSHIFVKRYNDHNLSVINECPKSNLLVYSTAEKWGPLCYFLNKDKPIIDFPTSVKLLQKNRSTQHPMHLQMCHEIYSSFVKFTMCVAVAMSFVNIYFIMFP